VEQFFIKMMCFPEILLNPFIGENWEDDNTCREDIVVRGRIHSIHFHQEFSGMILVVEIDGSNLPEGFSKEIKAIHIGMEMVGNEIVSLPAELHPDTIWEKFDGLSGRAYDELFRKMFGPNPKPFCED
jgi:hypothetical protein